MVLKSIGPMSLARVAGALYALMGLIFGAIFSLISVVGGALGAEGFGGMGLLFGAGAIVILPIFYGVLGFVFSYIGALLYNLLAGWVGGIELELK